MTLANSALAIDSYRKLRESGHSLEVALKQLFAANIGKLELISAVETVEMLARADARKIVVKVLAD